MVKYDVIYVNFPYHEHDGRSKNHPAVVLDGNKIAHLAAQLTSQVDKYAADTDYLLKDWQAAGLSKPSVVRLSQQEAFKPESVITVFGHLTDEDIKSIEEILNNNLEEDQCKIYDVVSHSEEDMKQLNESSVVQEIYKFEDGTILKRGWEKTFRGGTFYVDLKVPKDDGYITKFHQVFSSEEIAKDFFEDYKENKAEYDDDMSEEEFLEAFGKALIEKKKCK